MAWTPRSDTGGGNWSVFYRVLARRATKAAAQEQAERPGATLTVTLEELGISAQGILVVASPLAYGTLDSSLGGLSLTGTGGVVMSGAGSVTLGVLSSTGTSRLLIGASLSKSLGATTVVSTATIRMSGLASITLGAVTLSSSATAITAPTLTQTSSAGASPFLFDAQFNLNDTFAGYIFRVQTASGTGGDFTTPTQDISHTLTETDITSGDINISADGFLTPSGGFSLRARIERDDGITSLWSNTLTDTITASVAQLSGTTGSSKNTWATVSGTPRLSYAGTAGLGGTAPVRSTVVQASSKAQFEVTITGSPTDTFFIGYEDGTTDLNSGFPNPGYGSNTGIVVKFTGGSSIALWWGSGFSGPGDLVNTAGSVATGDTFTFVLDTSAHTMEVHRTRSGTTVQLGSTATSLPTLSAYYMYIGAQNGMTGTVNYGGSTYAKTPGSGVASVWA